MIKLLLGLIILLLAGIGALFLLSGADSDIVADLVSEVSNTGGVKTFVMTGENFKFIMNGVDNPDIRVKKGDIIRIEFSSSQGFHDWVVDEFSAATEKVRDTDSSTFVEFVVDQKGVFEYYCSIGEHRVNGMKGNLIVE